MSSLENSALSRFLDSISGFSPETFEEYESVMSKSAAELAGFYSIVRAEYSVLMPEGEILFEDCIRKGRSLVFSEKETSARPISFDYPIDKNGSVEFLVYGEKGKSFSGSEKWEIEFTFRQFYYILRSLVQLKICNKTSITDLSTGIPNLKAFLQLVGAQIARGRIGRYTALYFNIHNFKSVHKSMSFLEENIVLKKYAHTIYNAVTKNEIAAILGGDNFVALIYDEHKDYFFDLIQNMVINHEKDGEKISFFFGATIGAAKLTDEQNPGDVMMKISTAYMNARENRESIRYYDHDVGLEIIEKKIILSKFAKALDDREFFAVFQPKVDVKTRRLTGAEALVRWNHAGGVVMPGSFIPIIENDGCITALDFYMLEEVCKFLKRLQKDNLELVKISVNFSKRHLSNNALVEDIVEIIDRYGIPHQYIEIELTEGEDYRNQAAIEQTVNALNRHGINTSIDDFGTGYSSLAMLRSLEIGVLKIDKSFIPASETADDDKSLIMFRGIMSLAKNLGLTIVAEGVETPRQLEIMEQMNCDIVQGFIFDKPLTQDEFIERIKRKIYTLD